MTSTNSTNSTTRAQGRADSGVPAGPGAHAGHDTRTARPPRRRRLRSGTVVLGGVGLLAATLAACGSDPDKRCVDPVSYDVLPDSKCRSGGSTGTGGAGGGGGGKYYYGGTVSDGKVNGGSFDKSAVSRGGFGKSGSGGG